MPSFFGCFNLLSQRHITLEIYYFSNFLTKLMTNFFMLVLHIDFKVVFKSVVITSLCMAMEKQQKSLLSFLESCFAELLRDNLHIAPAIHCYLFFISASDMDHCQTMLSLLTQLFTEHIFNSLSCVLSELKSR